MWEAKQTHEGGRKIDRWWWVTVKLGQSLRLACCRVAGRAMPPARALSPPATEPASGLRTGPHNKGALPDRKAKCQQRVLSREGLDLKLPIIPNHVLNYVLNGEDRPGSPAACV